MPEVRCHVTSQIQTSKTAEATSYAVSPQLFLTSGSAVCLVNRYRTTGRCPFEAAFTVGRYHGSEQSQTGISQRHWERTQWRPAALAAYVNPGCPIDFRSCASTFAKPANDVEITLGEAQ